MTERAATKAGAPPCGLFLRISEAGDPVEQIRNLRSCFHVINASDYERNMHAVAMDSPGGNPRDPDRYAAFAGLCQMNGILFLTHDPGLAVRSNADGAILSAPGDLPQAREALGEDKILVLRCGSDAALAGKALTMGADTVAIGQQDRLPSPALVARWATSTDSPCIVEGPVTNDLAGLFVTSGAGFLDASDYIWNHPEGIMKGTVNMLYAIDLAARAREQ